MKTVPEEIVIIGGGVIGIEFAGIYQSFGAKVTVVGLCPTSFECGREITSRLKSLLEKRGISIMTGSKVEKIEKKRETICLCRWMQAAKSRFFPAAGSLSQPDVKWTGWPGPGWRGSAVMTAKE